MAYRSTEWERSSGFLDELRRQMSQLMDEFDTGGVTNPSLFGGSQVWPRIQFSDGGGEFVLEAEVPGLGQKDVNVSLEQDVLTISGERRAPVPEGYRAHRREREPFQFTRSFTLPARVDAEKAQATVKDGILTVVLPKTPEAQPRRIEIKAQ
jgi:HSP20 family protein